MAPAGSPRFSGWDSTTAPASRSQSPVMAGNYRNRPSAPSSHTARQTRPSLSRRRRAGQSAARVYAACRLRHWPRPGANFRQPVDAPQTAPQSRIARQRRGRTMFGRWILSMTSSPQSQDLGDDGGRHLLALFADRRSALQLPGRGCSRHAGEDLRETMLSAADPSVCPKPGRGDIRRSAQAARPPV